MKKYLIIIAASLTGCYPSNVLDEVTDAGFQKYIVCEFDNNRDGVISKQEALMVTKMTPDYSWDINNITGVEYFENLELYDTNCGSEESMDFSKNDNLKKISLMNMENLTTLKVNDNIEEVILNRVSIKELKFNDLPWLTWVVCAEGYDGKCLQSIEFKNCPNLKRLNVRGNQLTQLNLESFHILEELYVSGNKITTLDVSNNMNLSILRCKGVKNLIMKNGQKIEGVNYDIDYQYGIDTDIQIKYID